MTIKIKEFIKTVVRGRFGSIEYQTTPNMRKTNNPFLNRVVKVVKLSPIQLGVSYKNAMNNKREKQGLPRDFIPKKPTGKHWVDFPFFLESDKLPTTEYLRIELTANTHREETWYIDGRVATDAEISAIKTFAYASNEVYVRDIKFSNIISIHANGQTFKQVR